MTKPDDKTLHRLRVRIAELCGWKHSFAGYWWNSSWPPDAACTDIQSVPDYCRDLNAIHEAEAALPDSRRGHYACALQEIVGGADMGWHFAHAEAWQRAIALDRTLSEEPIV